MSAMRKMEQHVNGDGSQIIGQVLGGIIIYYAVTVNNNYYAVEADSSSTKTKDPQIGANPYQGLSAFQETDGDRFFGRKAKIGELWNQFSSLYKDRSATRLLTIYGPSGSGKSSLVRAGLIPELAENPLSGRKGTRVVVMVPGTRPLEALGLVLARIATNNPSPVEKGAEFKRVLEKKEDGRYQGLCQIANALLEIESQPLIVVVDQLEELFTLCKDSVEREAFIDNLLYATADQSKRVSAIVTLSSDFLGKAQQYSLDKSIENGLPVMAMDEEGLRQAIVEPAKLAWDLKNSKWYKPEVERDLIDVGTVNLLIEQTKGREGILPLLQFALQQIWVGLQAGEAPATTLDAIGGVAGALAGKAQRIYDSLKPEEQKIARRVFLGLVQLGEGVKDTRRRTELSRLISYRDNLEQVREIIGLFAHPDERLITLSNNGREDNKREETAEVTHEALFENWQQLKDWLNGGRSDLQFQRRLDDAVMVWQDNGRPEGNLWRSPDLDLLRRYQERAGEDMTSRQLEFSQASIDAKKRQDLAKKIVPALVFAILIFAANSIYLSQKNVDLDKRNADLDKKRTDLYNQYAFCPEKKGRPGKMIDGDTCFRQLKTSGEVGVFLSSTNFHLDRGIDAFRRGNQEDNHRNGEKANKLYEEAAKLFEQAVDGDRSDPVSRIFLNNAKARLRAKPPIKLAVVTSIDYYETAAKDVLRGVADAQDKFNNNPKNTGSLIEIVIANDENEKKAAKEVAKELVKDKYILGIIGHHASESTIAAQEIYKDYEIALISPTSSSSKLEGEHFFRIVGGTKKSAKLYDSYIRQDLGLKSVTVFFVDKSGYSKVLKEDFEANFRDKNGKKITNAIDIAPDKSDINIKEKIDTAFQNGDKVLLIMSNVKTNSVAIAISRENLKRPVEKRMKLISAMSLSEQETIEKGGNAVEGMVLVRPCLPQNREYYVDKAITDWQLKDINWRHSSSYDATQAFIKAIKQSKPVNRQEILSTLGSKSFSLSKDETSGFGLKWEKSDHGEKSDRSNANQKYCVVKVEKGKFKETGIREN